jgi:hypothetical protein
MANGTRALSIIQEVHEAGFDAVTVDSVLT